MVWRAPVDPLYALARPLLFSLDAETAHGTTLAGASFVARSPALTRLAEATYGFEAPASLSTHAFGLDFRHPIGLAAGLDKNGEAIDLWAAIGFSFVEVGTVTPGDGQPGNDKPRLYRAREDRALVNRMGFNNHGSAALAKKLVARRTRVPVGANLGKAKVTPLEQAADDYEATLRDVWLGADYIVVNVSSPNTPGLRDLQAVTALEPLLSRVVQVNRALADEHGELPRPILLKVAPDLAEADVDAVAELAVGVEVDGIIATNTTNRHELLSQPPPIGGGVSGAPLGPRALEVCRHLFRRLDGRLPIVGVGGLMNGDDVAARIAAGATLVQVYSALIYEGPGLVSSMVHGLVNRMKDLGVDSVSDLVGRDA